MKMIIEKVQKIITEKRSAEYYLTNVIRPDSCEIIISKEALCILEKTDPIIINNLNITYSVINFEAICIDEEQNQYTKDIVLLHNLNEPAIKTITVGGHLPTEFIGVVGEDRAIVMLPDADECTEWIQYGRHHNEFGPAIETRTNKIWYIDGKVFRKNGPSMEFSCGLKEWRIGFKLHRIDGPAVVNYNHSYEEFYLYDCGLPKDTYNKLIKQNFNIGDLVICDELFWPYEYAVRNKEQNIYRCVCEVENIDPCDDGFWHRKLTLKKYGGNKKTDILPFKFYDFQLIAIDPKIHNERYSMGVLDVCMRIHTGAMGGTADFLSDEENERLINFLQYRLDTWQRYKCSNFDYDVKRLIESTISLYTRK